MLKDGLPGAFVTALVLGVHELGHILVARDAGVKFGIPYFVPSWQVIYGFPSSVFLIINSLLYTLCFFTVQQISLLARGNLAGDWLVDDFIEFNWLDSFCNLDIIYAFV